MSPDELVRTGVSAGLAAWGALLVARPAATARAVTGGGPQPPDPVVRVLGARQLVQHLVLLRWSSPGVGWAAAGVDALHAASMAAAARIWPEYRRAELTSAAVAAGSAVLTALTVPRSCGDRR